MMTVFVTVNTVVLAMHYHGMDPDLEADIQLVNDICTYVFAVEMVLKMIAQGPKESLMEKLNYLDGTVVIISMAELIFLNSGASVISAFKTIRVF